MKFRIIAILTLAAGPLLAQTIPLEQAFEQCRSQALNPARAEFAGYPVEQEPTDRLVHYYTVDSDVGPIRVKLQRGSPICVIMGARFEPDHRHTTVAWDDVRDRSKAWVAASPRGEILSALDLDETGSNSISCAAPGVSVQVAASGGGTDDPTRALLFSAKAYPNLACD